MKKRSDERKTPGKKHSSSVPASDSRKISPKKNRPGINQSKSQWVGAASEFPLINRRAIAALCVTALAVFVIGLTIFRPSLAFLLSPASGEQVIATEDLDKGKLLSESATTSGQPMQTEFGLATAPGRSWQTTWTGQCESGAIPFVHLHAGAGGSLKNSLIFRLGNQVTTVTLLGPTSGNLIAPEGLTPGPTDYSVSFHSQMSPQAKGPALALDRIVVGSKIIANGTLDTSMFLIFWAALAPALIYFFVATISNKIRIAIIAAAVIAVASILILVFAPRLLMGLYAVLLVLYLPCLFAQDAATAPRVKRAIDCLGALAFGALIFAPRWGFLIHNMNAPLAADSLDYMQIAREMAHPFDTRYREPMFIWITRLWLDMTVWSPMMMRVLTLLLAYLVTVATWKLVRLFASPLIACLVTIAMLLNPALLASSVQGLREEIFPLSVLVHTYFCITFSRDKKPWRFWTLVALSAIVPLIRLNGLLYVIVALPLTFWQAKVHWRQVAIAAGIVVLSLLPTAIYQTTKYGEPFYSSNGYVATFYRNVEFKGQPGYPTVEEVAKDPWAGERVSMGKYVFGMHDLSEVISKSFAGAGSLLAGKSARNDLMRLNPAVTANYKGWPVLPQSPPRVFEFLLVLLFLGGCVYAFFRRDTWFLLVHLVFLQLPLSYLVGAGLLHWRLTMNGIPIMLILAGLALQGLSILARRSLIQDEA